VGGGKVERIGISSDARTVGVWIGVTLSFYRLDAKGGAFFLSEVTPPSYLANDFSLSADGSLASSGGHVYQIASGGELWSGPGEARTDRAAVAFAPGRGFFGYANQIRELNSNGVRSIQSDPPIGLLAFSVDEKTAYGMRYGDPFELVAVDVDLSYVTARASIAGGLGLQRFRGIDVVDDRVTLNFNGVFTTLDAKTLERRAVFLPCARGGYGFARGGAVDVIGSDADTLSADLVCRFGDRLVPAAVCAERDALQGSYAKALSGDFGYLEP
jgi:hypothetical protein